MDLKINQHVYLRKHPPVRLAECVVASVHDFKQCVTVRDCESERIVTRDELWAANEAGTARIKYDQEQLEKRKAAAKAKRMAARVAKIIRTMKGT